MNGINYVVGVYVGKRRNESVNRITEDPTRLVKMHIDRLSSLNVPLLKKATFVVSPSKNAERDEEVIAFVRSYRKNIPNISVDCFIGDNNDNHSYGSWNFGMKKYINEDMHFFLIEDDYFPTKDEFYLPFMEKLNGNVAYVCQLYGTLYEKFAHAAISNGLMNINAAKEHHNRFGQCIFTVENNKKMGGVWNQLHFLKNYENMNFLVKDISDKYFQPFLEVSNRITPYGNEKGEVLVEPIFYERSNG